MAIGVIATPSAAGHASQTGSSPAAGAVLEAAPTSVEVTFDTPLMDVGAALVVRSEDGTVVSDAPEVDRTAIRVAVPPDAPPGTYAVAFRVVSQDGHPITSTFDYTVAGDAPAATAPSTPAATAATAAPAPSASASLAGSSPAAPVEPSSGPPYALIAGGLLVLTLIVAGAIALRR
jgi:methionine-rich copper-binding protein CopC